MSISEDATELKDRVRLIRNTLRHSEEPDKEYRDLSELKDLVLDKSAKFKSIPGFDTVIEKLSNVDDFKRLSGTSLDGGIRNAMGAIDEIMAAHWLDQNKYKIKHFSYRLGKAHEGEIDIIATKGSRLIAAEAKGGENPDNKKLYKQFVRYFDFLDDDTNVKQFHPKAKTKEVVLFSKKGFVNKEGQHFEKMEDARNLCQGIEIKVVRGFFDPKCRIMDL